MLITHAAGSATAPLIASCSLSQQNELSAGEKKERQKELKCRYIPIFICKYPKQMLWQMEFPR